MSENEAGGAAAQLTEAPPQEPAGPLSRPGIGSLELFGVGIVLLAVGQRWISPLFNGLPALQTWATIFVSIIVQALPFLVFGVLLSASISAFVPPTVFAKILPKNKALAVPVAGISGVVLPGCECASVPVAGGLISRGVTPAAAFTFLLAAPAINPIVLVATAIAFPGRPDMVAARFVASLMAAMIMGWLWLALGKQGWLRPPRKPMAPEGHRWRAFREAAEHDFLHAGGFLVIGGITAATLNVVVPRAWLNAVAGNELLAILALAGLAVMLAICSEADAFVAASLTQFSLTARLAFLVVGPMVDVKLIALQAGTFVRAFAYRFAPTTFLVAVGSAVLVAKVVL